MDENQFRSFCETLIGKPYIFGAEGPDSFDCSGLAVFVLAHLGIEHEGRSTRGLHRYFVENGHGAPVDEHDVGLGDLCFYTNAEGRICHITVGWGGGQVFEAGRGDETTTTVAEARARGAEVMIADLHRHAHFKDAVRPHGLPWRTGLGLSV